MLPKTKLGEAMYRKLKVYAGPDHPHAAQKPTKLRGRVTWQQLEYYGTGRRKTSTARVFLRPGTGAITVNHRAFDEFFPTEALRTQIKPPLVLTETADKFDILATVAGGGVAGQAGALRLGIARALVRVQPRAAQAAEERRAPDARRARKERKKYGMAGARKRFQFSKR